MADYPEHEKLSGIKSLSQPLGEFLDWLRENGYAICVEVGEVSGDYVPCRRNIDQWLADFFQINLINIEQEKQDMLDEIRAANEANAVKSRKQ